MSTDGIQVGHFIREELEDMETIIVYISSQSSYAMNLFLDTAAGLPDQTHQPGNDRRYYGEKSPYV